MKSVINRAIKMARQEATSKLEAATKVQAKAEAKQEQKDSGAKKRKATYDDDELRALLQRAYAEYQSQSWSTTMGNRIGRWFQGA